MNNMRNFYKILLSLAVLLLWQAPVLARDNVTDWYIKDFKTLITVNQDSSLDITENILADCGNVPDKHGIFRVLSKKYKTADGNFILPLELISITDGAGNKLKYSVVSDSETITYQIGDPNISVHGENTYHLKYHVKNAIRTGNTDFDELYWNILGNYWNLEIDKFTAEIQFPTNITENKVKINLYSGLVGQNINDLTSYMWVDANTIEVSSIRTILKSEGVTISATFPKGIIIPYQLTFQDKYGFSIFEGILFLLFPLLTFGICYYFWNKYGRDPLSKKTIVPEFEIPENLTPIEMGGILKTGALENNSIAATIIRLGVLGYLKIDKVDTKVLFMPTSDFNLLRSDKAAGSDLYEAEKYILDKIFKNKKEVALKDIKLSFGTELPKISKILLDNLNSRQIIDKVAAKYQIIFFIVAAIMFGFSFIFIYSPIITFSVIICSVIFLVFAFIMDRLTLLGAELKLRIKGFKLYMDTAEKYRSQFQEQEGMLDKLLPYAILFGITTKWLKKMKDIYGDKYFENYHPAYLMGGLAMADFDSFTDSISQVTSGVATSIAPSASGSGGGGSAGGGGGGGGGGGW